MIRAFTRSSLCLALALAILAGCQNCPLRIPAIDKSGEHIFAPGNGSTALVSPLPPTVHAPSPAWSTPPQPQLCGYPPADPQKSCCSLCSLLGARPSMPNIPGAEPRVVLSPARLVAPVGSEVILAAGVTSPTGKSEHGAAIEWLLSQDSVGSFVSLAEEAHTRGHCRLIHGDPPHKVTNGYALGRTSSTEQLLTRGTANPADDLLLPAGQSWITLTSATEGVSNVTAYAPQTDAWERRQQTAQIYWIDAQWTFPPPAVGRAGQRVALTTNVMRHRTASPISGWSVIYDIVGGAPAAFDAQGGQSIEVPTDAAGVAAVQLLPASTQPGVTQVRVQIVRPAAANGSLPRLVVGAGQTTVTLSAPGLALQCLGPESVDVGGVVTYRVEIRNPGDLTAKGVVLTDELPPGLSFVGGGNPAPAVYGNRLEWNIGDLLPHSMYPLQFTCKAQQQGDLRNCLKARSADGLAADACAATRVVMSAIGLELSGPETAATGEQVRFVMKVTNRSQQKLTNVVISDQFDAGLRNAEGVSPIVRALGELAPGESRQIGVAFLVVGSGRICHTVTVTADGGLAATAAACVQATAGGAPAFTPGGPGPAAPAGGGGAAVAPIRLDVTGPAQQTDGKNALFTITLTNSGTTPLNEVQVNVAATPGLTITQAGPIISKLPTGYVWNVGRLEAGAAFQGQIEARCSQAPGSELQVTAAAAGVTPLQRSAPIKVVPAGPAASDSTDLSPGGAAGSGALVLNLSKVGDPVRRGESVTYNLALKNDRTDSDKRIAISIAVPAEVTVTKIDAGPLQPRGDGGQPGRIEFEPLAELRPGETFNIKIEAQGKQAGRGKISAQASSLRQTTPVSTEQDTTVLAE